MTTAVAVYSGSRRFGGGEGKTRFSPTVIGLASEINIDNCMLQSSCIGLGTVVNVNTSRGNLATDGDYIVIEWDVGFYSQGSTQQIDVEWSVTEFEASSMESNVQRGTADHTSDTNNITISAVEIDQSIYFTSARTLSPNWIYHGNERGFDISLTSTTNLRYYYKGTAPETGENEIAWQVVEFPAADVHIQHGITTYEDDTTDTLSGFTTLGNMFVMKCGAEGGSNGFGSLGRSSNQVKINSLTELGFNMHTLGSGDLSCSWTVVELLGGGTVHKGELTMADTVGSVNGSFTAVDLDFACIMRSLSDAPNGYIDDTGDSGTLTSVYNTEHLDADGAGITVNRSDEDADWTQQYAVVEWVNGTGPTGVTPAGVTTYTTTATVTAITKEHRVDAGTTLLTVVISTTAQETVTVVPAWGGVDLTLVRQSTSSGVSTDMHNYVYALENPTAGVDDITLTVSSSAMAHFTATNWMRTEDASVAAAIIFLNEDVNDTATSTSVHASAGTTGRTLLYAGCAYGDDMNDGSGVTNDDDFVAIGSGSTGISISSDLSYYIAVKIAGAASGITVNWDATDENASQLFEIVPGAAAAQELTPGLFTDTNIFYAPTVTTGAVTLTPGLFSETNIFYAPTVGSTYGLTPGLFTEVNVFYAPTVSSTYGLAPGLFTETNIFYAPTVTTGAVVLTPGLFTETNIFYAPTVTVGAVVLAPGLFTETNIFYAPTVTVGGVILAPGLLTNVNIFYAPAVTQDDLTQELTPSLLTNVNIFYAATVATGPVTLTPGLFTNTNIFYTHVITGGQSTLPDVTIQPRSGGGGAVPPWPPWKKKKKKKKDRYLPIDTDPGVSEVVIRAIRDRVVIQSIESRRIEEEILAGSDRIKAVLVEAAPVAAPLMVVADPMIEEGIRAQERQDELDIIAIASLL